MCWCFKYYPCGEQGLDFFGGPEMKTDAAIRALQWETDNREARVVVISDLCLDRPQTLDRLQAVLSGRLPAPS